MKSQIWACARAQAIAPDCHEFPEVLASVVGSTWGAKSGAARRAQVFVMGPIVVMVRRPSLHIPVPPEDVQEEAGAIQTIARISSFQSEMAGTAVLQGDPPQWMVQVRRPDSRCLISLCAPWEGAKQAWGPSSVPATPPGVHMCARRCMGVSIRCRVLCCHAHPRAPKYPSASSHNLHAPCPWRRASRRSCGGGCA